MSSRRSFIRRMTTFTGALMCRDVFSASAPLLADRWGALLPQRALGRTGERITMLGVGGFHIGWTSERDAQEVIETAIAGGVRFFDTAHNYGKGLSEERYGQFLVPKYRDDIFLMTKSQAADRDGVLREFDLSRKRLGVDSVDLLQLHSLKTPDDVVSRIDNGVLDALTQILESGGTRYVGFTGHQNPYAHLEMLKRVPEQSLFSTLQMPINPVDGASEHSFVRQVLPDAVEQGLGVLAMKTLADGRFFDRKEVNGKVRWQSDTPVIPTALSVSDALQFAWSLPISTLITGAENKGLLEEKIELARSFSVLTDADRQKLLEQVLVVPNRTAVEYYKQVG
ncbi:aldo/keto reductase [Tichowtungia aerotolerans]|uniref:Aldo/keto reductase n=1 Tax=Tichowtungia aerotolerans TaxID=2697043 RepID=A0A6P1M9Y1_9BACT|nr:aldo/keto reductase [Tichowtungia aerotolerans]QHI70727.1 aldo/keto reductase [Tichowtungia aerotolerans]